ALLDAISPRLKVVAPFGAATEVAKITLPWNGARLSARIGRELRVVWWSGMRIRARYEAAAVTSGELLHGWPAGSQVGTLVLRDSFGTLASLPVDIGAAIKAPPSGTEPSPLPPRIPIGS
ncbi:MAG: hypothetical protein ACRDZT_06930, partial [Acidimicrobiales bacterium]